MVSIVIKCPPTASTLNLHILFYKAKVPQSCLSVAGLSSIVVLLHLEALLYCWLSPSPSPLLESPSRCLNRSLLQLGAQLGALLPVDNNTKQNLHIMTFIFYNTEAQQSVLLRIKHTGGSLFKSNTTLM